MAYGASAIIFGMVFLASSFLRLVSRFANQQNTPAYRLHSNSGDCTWQWHRSMDNRRPTFARRLDTSSKLCLKHIHNSIIVVSGGLAFAEKLSEAKVMRQLSAITLYHIPASTYYT